ncbi:MAG: trehalose-phosphatase [Bowdeniella nasicola]|nr:trehalose-phosphatase [Bowdeniella nasicola]
MTMASLDPDLAAALNRAADAAHLLVALDFDGSLAPLVDRPEDARMLPRFIPILERFAEHPHLTLALVSGRAGDSLAACAEVPDHTIAVGSHGSQHGEILAAPHRRRRFVSEEAPLSAEEAQLLALVRSDAHAIATSHPGVHLEDKPTAVVVHTRRAAPQVGAAAQEAARRGPAARPGVSALEGKEVIELAVRTATKGEALLNLVRQTGATFAIYAGDDVTDEHAFSALANADIPHLTIRVGPGESAATHRVADPEALADALSHLADRLS